MGGKASGRSHVVFGDEETVSNNRGCSFAAFGYGMEVGACESDMCLVALASPQTISGAGGGNGRRAFLS